MTTATESHKLGGRPGRLLMMAAVGLVAVAVVWAAVILIRGNLGGSGANPAPPPPPATTVPASPSPTLSEREQESADAKEVFVQLRRALDDFNAAGGGTELPDEIVAMTTEDGTSRESLSQVAASEHEGGYASTGYTEVKDLKVRTLDMDAATASADLVGCLDLTGLEVTKDGEVVDPQPVEYMSAKATMHKVDGRWLLHDSLTEAQEGAC